MKLARLKNRGPDYRTEVMSFERPSGYTDWRPPNPPALQDREPIGLDFEYRTFGSDDPKRWRPFSLAVYSHERRESWYLPWAHEGGGNLPEEIVRRWIQRELPGRDIYGVATKFEGHMLRNLDYDVDRSRLHDVAFGAALIDETLVKGFSLKSLAENWLPETERKVHPTTVEEVNFWRAHAGEVAVRCTSDARQAYLIHLAMKPEIERQRLQRVLDVEDRCIAATVEMERNGARLNRGKLERWKHELELKITELTLELHRRWGCLVSPNSGPSMRAFWNTIKERKYPDLKFPTVFENDEWVESWDSDAIDKICRKKDKVTGEWVILNEDVYLAHQLKHYLSLKSKYVDKFLLAMDSNNTIYYSLHQLRAVKDESDPDAKMGTVTGRFSSSGGKFNINIQQEPKVESQLEEWGDEFVIRETFVPDDGYVTGASDASQIEFRLFGHLSQAPFIIEAYRQNPYVDFHMMVTKMMKPGVTDPRQLKFERNHMKHNNFGCIYGMGRPKLARKLGFACVCQVNWYERDDNSRRVRYFHKNSHHLTNCPARQANDIMDEYEEKFPEAKQQLDRCSKLANKFGYVTTYYGRRGRFMMVNGRAEKGHKALNKRIQGTAADYFKIKMIELHERRRELDIKLRAPVHDEFVYDVQPEYEAAEKVQVALDEQSWKNADGTPYLLVPLLWETGTGPSWRHANEDKSFMKRFKLERGFS